jgi:alpha-1,6-mannosyltransferase
MRGLKPELSLGLCGALLIALTALGLTVPRAVIGQFGIGYGRPLDLFVFLEGVQGVIYVAAVFIVLRARPGARLVWIVLGAAFLARAMVVIFPPFLSNDIYRYVWDGWVQGAGINPYRYIPADPHLAFLRDASVFPNINRANYAPTIYPPAAEMIFCVVAGLAKLLGAAPVLTMKLAMLTFEAGGIWAMLRLLDHAGLPRARILIYAWNPVALWEFAGSGHVDAIAICFIAFALLAAVEGKSSLSAVALAAATLTKFLPVVLLPALWRRSWKFAVVFTLCIAALYLPYLGAGKAVLGFLGGYNAQEGIDSGTGIFLLSIIGHTVNLPAYASKIYLLIFAMVFIGLGLVMMFGQRFPSDRKAATELVARNALLLGCVLMAGLSPHYPWYYCWLLIPACILPWSSTLYLVTASFLLYLNPTHTELFWPAMVYGPFFILAAMDAWMVRFSVAPNRLQFAEGDRI